MPTQPEVNNASALPPIWRLAFRPFFVSGAVFAVAAISLWISFLLGWLPTWNPPGGALAWHRHEMPFGFTSAIIAGFLLTALQTWTGRPGIKGIPLAIVFTLWLVARLAWFLGLPTPVLLALQLLFLPALALLVGRELIAVRQRNNYPILVVLMVLAGCQVLALAGILYSDDGLQRRGELSALWMIAALMGVIGGRVIPFFTQRGLNLPAPFKAHPRLDRLGLLATAGVAILTAAGFSQTPHLWMAALFAVVSVLHGSRLWRWHHTGIWGVPLLWSLHMAYAWLVIAALGMMLWHLGVLDQQSLATHSLAVGSVGGLILAMLARVSLGHTGRPLQPAKAINVAFMLINAAAFSRVVLVPFCSAGLWLSGVLWALAFMLFARYYAMMFFTPRPDGGPG
ncbi:NnrS family protein [Pseudomonas sp. NA-150]|uniref:NnrS family protein n=1 Tax=Pseudomonas sp. NA-150 TaxID=3367525 RepID=UPI0037C95360